MCARFRIRPRQYDFIQAYLQCDVHEPLFCQMSSKYIPYLPKELHQYCGVPLRCKKALYGWHRSGQLLWQAVEQYLKDFGLTQSIANGALWFLRRDEQILLVLQYSDDGLYACNDDKLEQEFSTQLHKRFDCNVNPAADWYLQSHITQDKHFDVTLDQQRYCLSMLRGFLPNLPDKPSQQELRRYLNPLPTNCKWLRSDRSTTQEEVKALEQEFGFRYIVPSTGFHRMQATLHHPKSLQIHELAWSPSL